MKLRLKVVVTRLKNNDFWDAQKGSINHSRYFVVLYITFRFYNLLTFDLSLQNVQHDQSKNIPDFNKKNYFNPSCDIEDHITDLHENKIFHVLK